MVYNIYRPQSISSFISNFSHDSEPSDFFSATPDTSDVSFLLYHVILHTFVYHILPGDLDLQHSSWG